MTSGASRRSWPPPGAVLTEKLSDYLKKPADQTEQARFLMKGHCALGLVKGSYGENI